MSSITCNAISAAKQIGGDITVLVAGTKCDAVAKAASNANGINKVLLANSEAFKGLTPESLTPLILAMHEQNKYTHLLAGASAFGKSLLPRVSTLDILGFINFSTGTLLTGRRSDLRSF